MSVQTGFHEMLTNFRSVFNDFGTDFTCADPTGENPQTGMVVHVEEVRGTDSSVIETEAQSEDALVTCLDETRHGLEDGDFVTFSEIQGMEEINGAEPRKVSVKGLQAGSARSFRR